MLSLTVLDQVRLDFNQVARNHMVHARAAERLAGAAFKFRLFVLIILAAATSAAIVNALFPTKAAAWIVLATTAITLIGFAVQSAVGLEARVQAHRLFANRLWLIGEGYRSLIAEADERLIDRDGLLHRRDALLEDVHHVYGQSLATDESGYETERALGLSSEPAA